MPWKSAKEKGIATGERKKGTCPPPVTKRIENARDKKMNHSKKGENREGDRRVDTTTY